MEGTAVFIVAGATGNVGSAVVRKLAGQGSTIKALTRSSAGDKAAPLKELAKVEVIECDLMNKSGLTSAFAGATAAFLACSNSLDQVDSEKNFIDCAVAAGITYLVKLGTVRSYTSVDSPVQYARYHAEIEDHLAKTAGNMKWTVLCPNWFMTNHLGDVFGTLPNSIIAYPINGDHHAKAVDPRDIGDIGAQLLLASDPTRFHGLKLDISGPEEVSMSQIAELYAEALGRKIDLVTCTEEGWIAGAVASGFPDWLARAVALNFPKWKSGEMSFPSSPEVLALPSPPHRTMAQWIKEWAPRSPPAATP